MELKDKWVIGSPASIAMVAAAIGCEMRLNAPKRYDSMELYQLIVECAEQVEEELAKGDDLEYTMYDRTDEVAAIIKASEDKPTPKQVVLDAVKNFMEEQERRKEHGNIRST